MSRPSRRDPRRNVIKPQMEKLEIRWLLSQAQDVTGMGRTRERLEAEVGGGLGRTLSAELAHWEAHHPNVSGSGVIALEAFEAESAEARQPRPVGWSEAARPDGTPG